MNISTYRLELRSFVSEDITWYRDLVKSEEVAKWLPGLAYDNEEVILEDIRIFMSGDFKNDFYLVVCEKDGNVVGIINAVRMTGYELHVSYFLFEEYRHKGYMSEALEALIYYARSICEWYDFRLQISKDNIASINVAKRLGARIMSQNDQYICYI